MLKLSNLVEFGTSRQKYIYDPFTTRVISTTDSQTFMIKNFYKKESSYDNMNKLFGISKSDYFQMKQYIQLLIDKFGMFYYEEGVELSDHLSVQDIKDLTVNTPTSQLILVVTESCNLRCEYCVYSDKYPKDIAYSPKQMDFEVAKLAIDKYFELHKARLEHGLNKAAAVSFYGGEPLLNFDLIKKCVNYINSLGFDTIFYITTNATILNEEMAEFLIKNNFSTAFSIDGYKSNHDRNRVFVNGGATFDLAMKNIRMYKSIMNKLNNKASITFNCCYDLYTDLTKAIDFFESIYDELYPFYLSFAPIKPVDTTYYQWCDARFKDGGNIEFKRDNYLTSKNKVENKLFYGDGNSKAYQHVAGSLFLGELVYDIRNKTQKGPILRNSCIPLSKMAVTYDGSIVMCEKMCEKFPIGNVKSDIDWDACCKITNQLIDFFNSEKCSKCKAKSLCDACFMFLDDNGNISEDYCEQRLKNFNEELARHYKLYEDNINIVSMIRLNSENTLNIREEV